MWMIANVAESDSPLFHRGLPVDVQVAAYPDRAFAGRVTYTGSEIDRANRTVKRASKCPTPTTRSSPECSRARR